MKTKRLARLPSLLLPVFAWASATQAADYYMTKSGAGAKTGANWENALPAAIVVSGKTVFNNAALNALMQPGDTLLLGGENYGDLHPQIDSSGAASARKSIIGVDRGSGLPLFYGATRSYTGIGLKVNSNYWTLKDIKVEFQSVGVAAWGATTGLILDNIAVRNVADRGFAFTDSDNLLVENCSVNRYNKVGFFFIHSCDGVTVRNCFADCSGTGFVSDPAWKKVVNPIGFKSHTNTDTTNPPNTNLLFEDCVTMNNDQDTDTPDDYEQGDGFMAEQRTNGLTLIRCRSLRNQDGAYDLKGQNQLLEDCVALTSRHGFKLWYSGTLNNCLAVSNWAFNLQVAGNNPGYTITANYCTFHATGTNPVGVKVEVAGNTAIVNNSIISRSGTQGSYTGGGTVTLNNTATHSNASNTANAPQYINPISNWDGIGNNYDNQTYGLTKGYSSIGSAGGTIHAEADTYVWDGAATTNYGTATSLVVKDVTNAGFDRISYIRFPLAGLSGAANSAVLRIKVTSIGNEGAGPRTVEVRQVADDAWSETTTTWNTRPAAAGALIATIDAGTVGAEYTVDVTSYVNSQLADGKASFVLIQPSGVGKYIAFASREDTANQPALDVD